MLKKAQDDEAKVFYIKMKGDYNRYIGEYAEGDLKKKVSDEAKNSYSMATEIAENLPIANPIRLGLALNYSVYYYEILEDHDQACKIAQDIIDKAEPEITNMDEEAEENRDMIQIFNLLKENLEMWKADEENRGN